MPHFVYQSLNESGRKIRGKITAANEVDLEGRLKSIGLDLISCKETKEGHRSFFDRLSSEDLIILCIHLEQLERAGVPILDALVDIRDTSEKPALKTLITEIYESIKGGKLLSEALAQHPKVFNKVFIGLVGAGEQTGNLSEVFAHLSRHLKWIHFLQKKIQKATYYPIFLLILMSGILALMMMYVIPKLSKFLTSQNFDLPIYTTALIATSNFFIQFWYIVFIGPVALYIALKTFGKLSDNVAYKIDTVKLWIPYIGGTIRKIELARFCHFFSITFRSGLGILECLDIAQNVVKNRVIKENVSVIKRSVSEGSTLTAALNLSNQFPNLVVRMFKVGEESGKLDTTLDNINYFYDREVNDAVSNMVAIIQPALTIVMGGIMLWISMAVFGPLYSSFSKMSFS